MGQHRVRRAQSLRRYSLGNQGREIVGEGTKEALTNRPWDFSGVEKQKVCFCFSRLSQNIYVVEPCAVLSLWAGLQRERTAIH